MLYAITSAVEKPWLNKPINKAALTALCKHYTLVNVVAKCERYGFPFEYQSSSIACCTAILAVAIADTPPNVVLWWRICTVIGSMSV